MKLRAAEDLHLGFFLSSWAGYKFDNPILCRLYQFLGEPQIRDKM